jgi:hypothetical protein
MESEELSWLNKKKEYLIEWKDRLKYAEGALPLVEQTLENTSWEIETIQNRPATAGGPAPELVETFKREYYVVVDSLPQIPNFDQKRLSTASTVNISGTAYMYRHLTEMEKSDTPELRSYAQAYLAKYDALQDAQQRQQQTRTLVQKLNSASLLSRFDQASEAVVRAKSALTTTTQAASEMRNLLYGVNGELIEFARATKREAISWSEIAKRLAKPDPSDVAYNELCKQGEVYKALTDHLSNIAKDHVTVSLEELSHIWTQVLDHIYMMLELVNLPK